MTDMTDFQRFLREKFPKTILYFEEPLARHTSFRIGGPCEVMALPGTEEELSGLFQAAREWGAEVCVLGAGTNVLARDEGRRGLVISTRDGFSEISQISPVEIRAGSGVSMARLANFAARLGLTGLEFAQGIPGTVGGGLYMNAGAYGGELKDWAVRTDYMTPEGQIKAYRGEEQGFSYRKSAFSDRGGMILGGEFRLMPGDPKLIEEKMAELANRRRASQPLDMPSAGSTFKRPEGGYAAALIDQAGLKGFRIGGAAVSEKHAGFVVNLGGAMAKDVLALIEEIQKRVFETSGIRLEPEVRMI